MFYPTPIAGVYLLSPTRHTDSRGYFCELWRADIFPDGAPRFVQENQSVSKRAGTLRGLHAQIPPQGKLIKCQHGRVFDVALDARASSATYGQWFGVELWDDRQIWLPEGILHGFQTLSEDAVLTYKCTEYYAPKGEITIAWDSCGIKWPLPPSCFSEKDKNGLNFKEFETPFG